MRKLHLIIAIFSVVVIFTLAITAIVINNKTKEANSKISENLQDLNTNEETQNLEGEYIDINELDENMNVEDPNNMIQNTNSNSITSTNNNKVNGGTPYYIKVNYGAQVVTIYKKDSEGNYTVPVKAMVCSTGVATPTSGVYSIPASGEWLRLKGYVWGHYSTQITGNILFHSVPYLRKGDLASLEYWEYDKLGTYASAGCIRLTTKDAKWIFDNCAKGTKVEFYSDSNPGPLGKPTAKKISSYPDYLRNWDPTDPNANNPWRNNNSDNNQTNTNTQTDTQPGTNTNVQVNNIEVNETINTNTSVNTQVNEQISTKPDISTNVQVNETTSNDDKTKVNSIE